MIQISTSNKPNEIFLSPIWILGIVAAILAPCFGIYELEYFNPDISYLDDFGPSLRQQLLADYLTPGLGALLLSLLCFFGLRFVKQRKVREVSLYNEA